MKNFRAADKSHAGGDEKHDINFHWPSYSLYKNAKYEMASIVVVFEAIQITCSRVLSYLRCLCCALAF